MRHLGPRNEARTRSEIAAATLMLCDAGIMSYSGHVSARLSGADETFLIQSIDQPRNGLRPEHLIVCDLDTQLVGGDVRLRPPIEVALHAEIYRARPDVRSVAHFHYDLATSFTLVEDVPLQLVKNHAVRWRSGIPVHDDPGHVAGAERGRTLARTLGPHHACQIRAHGQVIVAESVPAVFHDTIHFIENADAHHAAASIGKVRPLSTADLDLFEAELKRDRLVDKLWAYYLDGSRRSGVLPDAFEL
jgi:ribulose-5-phosphate 4-epimerase/fuculose-1-phosphate aldolase